MIDWDEMEKLFGPYPRGTVYESAFWVSQVEGYLKAKEEEKKKEAHENESRRLNIRIEIYW